MPRKQRFKPSRKPKPVDASPVNEAQDAIGQVQASSDDGARLRAPEHAEATAMESRRALDQEP